LKPADDNTLRSVLRRATEGLHSRLDTAMPDENLSDPVAYGRFLSVQHAARLPVEKWAARHCPPAIRPPELTPLLERDLGALGWPLPEWRGPFVLPAGADPVGLAWVIAGSALGGKALLKRVREDEGAQALPTAFLADERALEFWHDLRPALERQVDPHCASAAVRAAEATFGHFLRIAEEPRGRLHAA